MVSFQNKNRSFTLIELLVVVAIIALLMSYTTLNYADARQKSRDAKRFGHISEIGKALNLYMSDNGGKLPSPTCPPCLPEAGGWETSDASPDISTDWMEYLKPYFHGAVPADPINKRVAGFSFFGPRPGNYFYAYYRYDPPPTYCPGIKNPISIIAISNLESFVRPELPETDMPLPLSVNFPRAKCGDPGPDGICSVAEYNAGQCRDWSQEFDYSIMFVE